MFVCEPDDDTHTHTHTHTRIVDRYDMFVNFFQVSNSRDAAEHLKFLQSVLGPYLEGYWWLAVELATSEDELPNGQEKDMGGNMSFTVAFV